MWCAHKVNKKICETIFKTQKPGKSIQKICRNFLVGAFSSNLEWLHIYANKLHYADCYGSS